MRRSSLELQRELEMENDLSEVAKPDMCAGCGLCRVVCPGDAIGLNEVRPLDYIPDSWRH